MIPMVAMTVLKTLMTTTMAVPDTLDAFPTNASESLTNCTATSITDHDSDGCQDSSEDADDDNDGVLDLHDLCPGFSRDH